MIIKPQWMILLIVDISIQNEICQKRTNIHCTNCTIAIVGNIKPQAKILTKQMINQTI
jgi:hypothetical protein